MLKEFWGVVEVEIEEICEGELKEIRYVISLAKEDKDIKELLLKELKELDIDDEELYEERVKRIIKEANEDSRKKAILIDALLTDGEIYATLDEHFHTYFEEIGEIRGVVE